MTVSYAVIRKMHVATAALSLALFVLRAAWMLASPARLQMRWVKIVPHLVDTLLLAAALWLAWQLGADGTRGWLAAKVIAVLVYIAAGTVALKRGRTRRVRVAALFVALATFGYIVSVALTKSTLGFLTWI
jgi:uncharacterized membrane protein SirB2